MKKSFRFRYLGLIILGLFLISPLLVYASEPYFRLNKGVVDFFRIDGGSGVRVHDYEAFFNIVNNCSADLFIGNKTPAEWLSFWDDRPSCVAVTNRFCGDSICQTYAENASTCAADCSYCGDHICDATEDRASCMGDCINICGDGACDSGERHGACLEDCGICGDGYCYDETVSSCPVDCAVCGDGICATPYETYYNCIFDCAPICGDGICAGEAKRSCPLDCVICGDGYCDMWFKENKDTCPSDCRQTTTYYCGDGVCRSSYGENVYTCSFDCRTCRDGTCSWPYENVYNCEDDCTE